MRHPPYPACKDSGVEWLGEIPVHWEVRRLKFVSEVNPGRSEVKTLDKDTIVSFLPMEQLGSGSLNLEQSKTLGEVGQGFTYIREGDILIAKITPSSYNKFVRVWNPRDNDRAFRAGHVGSSAPPCCTVR